MGETAFSDNRVFITLPTGYSSKLEENGLTIAIYPPDAQLFEFRLTYHSLSEQGVHNPALAQAGVNYIAQKKGLAAHKIVGGKEIGFIEPGTIAPNEKGVLTRSIHGVFSLNNGYVTMTLSVPESKATDPKIENFLAEGGMESLTASLRAPQT